MNEKNDDFISEITIREKTCRPIEFQYSSRHGHERVPTRCSIVPRSGNPRRLNPTKIVGWPAWAGLERTTNGPGKLASSERRTCEPTSAPARRWARE